MSQDYTTSNNPKFLFYAELHHPFPDWVVAQPIPKASDFEKMASTAFADMKRRLLPVCTKEATFHSALNYMAHAADFSEEVADRIKNACDFFEISIDVAPYAEVFADKLEKEASAEQAPAGRFAIDTTINGAHYQLLPINDSVDVSDSAFELAKMASENRIHFLNLLPAARVIVKAAEEHEVKVPTLISRVGTDRTINWEKAASLVAGRAGLATVDVDKSQLQQHYDSAVKEAAAGECTPDECIQKIAACDHAAGVRYNYGRTSTTPLPSEIVFCGPVTAEVEKMAKQHVVIGDVLIPLEEFRKIDMAAAEYKLSKEAAQSLLKVADTDNALDIGVAVMGWDDDDQRTLLRLAAAV